MKKITPALRIFLILTLLAGCTTFHWKKTPGFYYEWKQGDRIEAVAKKYGQDAFELRKLNVIVDLEDLEEGMMIYIPTDQAEDLAFRPRFPDERAKFKIYGGKLIWPSPGKLTSKFGHRWGKKHEGIDMGQNAGLDIRAAGDGVVEFAGRQRGYGKTLIIDHGRGIKTLYAHNSRIHVDVGQTIRKGQKISKMGKTGRSTGVHLHFEVRVRGVARNPLAYLPSRG